MEDEAARLTQRLAEATGTDAADWFPVYKARYGMAVVFEALAATDPAVRTVITQPFTCCTAVDPILVAGLTPLYGDIDADTISLDPAKLPLEPGVGAVVLQHSFGIIDDDSSRALVEKVHGAGAWVVEDSAHCATRMARDDQDRPVADVSVHSFGAEKMCRTSFGGAIWLNPQGTRPEALALARKRLGALEPVSGATARAARLYLNENRVLNRLPRGLAKPLRRGLIRGGLMEPAVADEEMAGGLLHDRPMAPDTWICAQAVSELDRLPRNMEARKAVVQGFIEGFGDAVDYPNAQAATPVQPLLRFSVVAPSTEVSRKIIQEVRSLGYLAEDWYRPSLYPGVADPAVYHLPAPGTLPVCDRVTAGIVNLPTEVDPGAVAPMVETVIRNLSR